MKKRNWINITRQDWIDLIALDEKNNINKRLGAKFICQEIIKKTDDTVTYRVSMEDTKSHRLFCVKFLMFKNEEGKPDIAINTNYTDKLYYL